MALDTEAKSSTVAARWPKPRALLRAMLAFLVLTMILGVTMRWDFATGVVSATGLSLANLRHAHSHAGFYGALTLGWWLVAQRSGPVPHRWLFGGYLATASTATCLFAFLGYRAVTIVLSTIVAAVWLQCGLSQWRRRGHGQWLDVAPLGLAAGTVLVPCIAVMAKRDFELSRALAHVFIASMLFTVFVPAAWQSLALERKVRPVVYFVLAIAASVHLVFDAPLGTAGALAATVYAALTFRIVWEGRAGYRLWWLVLPVSIFAASWSAALRTYSFRIAGLHLLILGPVLTSLLAPVLRVPLPAVWLYVMGLMGMVASLVLPSVLVYEHATLLMAVAATFFFFFACVAAAIARAQADLNPLEPD